MRNQKGLKKGNGNGDGKKCIYLKKQEGDRFIEFVDLLVMKNEKEQVRMNVSRNV